MLKQVIYSHYGSYDKVNLAPAADEQISYFDLTVRKKLGWGIQHILREMAFEGIFPSDTARDLLILATTVQLADTRISRTTNSQDTWTREIKIIVPVSSPEIWNNQKRLLTRILNFLTGDIWEFEFRKNPNVLKDILPDLTIPLIREEYDTISLFSGGLDSLIGSIDLLELNHRPVLVSHAGDGTTSKAQLSCLEELARTYSPEKLKQFKLWMNFPGMRIKDNPVEKTTRGRSFLFFTLGVLVGTGLSKNFTLLVPENGFIAINVPLDSLRLGSHSTRTTHPFYIARWNELLTNLNISGKIVNPYWNQTKGEMVLNCKNKSLLKRLIPESISCSSPTKGNFKGSSARHCGYCLPCLIRKASIRKGFPSEQDPTDYYISDFKSRILDSSIAEGVQVRSFQIAISRLKKNPDLSKVLIHSSGSLSDLSLGERKVVETVYTKGMNEVEKIIEDARTRFKNN